MKQENSRSRRIRVIAAICAMVILAASSAGVYSLRRNQNAKAAPAEKAAASSSASTDEEIISAGGTVTSAQLGESLCLENTSVRLSVEKVLVETGQSITAGTPICQLSTDSLQKAEKTLKSELQSAESALLEEKMSYQTDKNEAYLLYKSDLLLGETAQAEYDIGIKSLDSELNKAKEEYEAALDTINNSPAEIESKQAELTSQQNNVSTLTEKKEAAQSKADEAKKTYTSAAETYNSAAEDHNSAASVVRYLGKALGKDTSGFSGAQKVTADIQEQEEAPEENVQQPESDKLPADMPDSMPESMQGERPAADFNFEDKDSGERKAPLSGMPQGKDEKQSSGSEKGTPAEQKEPASTDTQTAKVTADKNDKTESKEVTANSSSSELKALYETALSEYNTQNEKLKKAETAMQEAEKNYNELAKELSDRSSELKEAQNAVSSLNKEISSLNTALSKAKSNISKLRSEYNSLQASYETDKLELKNKLDTDTASSENAEYHYQITCSTLDKELEEKQTAYDTAQENLRIFSEDLADGNICAKQDGTIYSLSCQEGRSINTNSPYVYYVDESRYSTTVEVDQNDVTKINIGNDAAIYSSETGIVTGKITAISAGTSTSLADVRFNVTVTADEGASLYVGQSVNVYFNYGDMKTGDFSDFTGGKDSTGGKPDFGGERPDFSGGMPEGFDPSNIPDFRSRKDD